jgi:hypothetical protein
METAQIVLLALLGLVVAFLVPVLVQARRSLRSAEIFLESTRPKVERTLTDLQASTARFNEMTASIERTMARVRPSMSGAAEDLTRSISSFRGSLGIVSAIGAALGPALAAGLKAIVTRGRGGGTDTEAGGAGAETAREPRREAAHE